ncbi:MAG TPA: magnesium transporter [Deltaproteobacteria bacterium]|nr:MAG: magnesium transporter [Deltaproteobacteria bacterium GWA2_45_12]HBF12157.1 magnesium transporter [Deltaproteobacteria bacterium]
MEFPRSSNDILSLEELEDVWPILQGEERLEALYAPSRPVAENFFLQLSSEDQADILTNLPEGEKRSWIRLLPPDDAADVLQIVNKEQHPSLLQYLDEPTRKEVTALLAYAEDDAGGLMNPRYARLRPDMPLDEAISYLKRQTRAQIENIYYIYVLDEGQHLLGVVSYRDLFSADPQKKIRDIMRTHIVKADEAMDQEALGQLFKRYKFLAVPVVDSENRLKGVVTVDDIVDVMTEEATEDIQKLGAVSPLEMPYMKTSIFDLVKKRAGWLSVLFLGEMLTASAMSRYALEIEKAVVLALFLPLIISSGGNSGSQASTLVIRAMAVGEITLRDWWRVAKREIFSGLALGGVLGVIGFIRIFVWQYFFESYGEHYTLIAITLFASLIGVVLIGTIAGSMLPFILSRLKLDPASASAPFVATLVDVGGLIIYFSIAALLLQGSLL